MKVIEAPNKVNDYKTLSVFLAGSIEMGQAEEWQSKVINSLAHLPDDLLILNPRRKDWDSSWIQSIKNKQFREQVEWEINKITNCDLVLFYFDPNTKSPITLMELGLVAGLDIKCVVCCPEPFYRKGNVDIICNLFDIKQVSCIDDFVKIVEDDYSFAHMTDMSFDWKNGV